MLRPYLLDDSVDDGVDDGVFEVWVEELLAKDACSDEQPVLFFGVDGRLAGGRVDFAVVEPSLVD